MSLTNRIDRLEKIADQHAWHDRAVIAADATTAADDQIELATDNELIEIMKAGGLIDDKEATRKREYLRQREAIENLSSPLSNPASIPVGE